MGRWGHKIQILDVLQNLEIKKAGFWGPPCLFVFLQNLICNQLSDHIADLTGWVAHLARSKWLELVGGNELDGGIDFRRGLVFAEGFQYHLHRTNRGQRIDHALPRVLRSAAADGNYELYYPVKMGDKIIILSFNFFWSFWPFLFFLTWYVFCLLDRLFGC